MKPIIPSVRRLAYLSTSVAAAAAATVWLVVASPGAAAAAPTAPVSVFPIPGGHAAIPTTQLTFRGVPASQLGTITVTGSVSGAHAGRVVSDSDGNGGSFLPSTPFTPGETVTVQTGLNIVGGTGGSYTFTVATPAGPIKVGQPFTVKRVPGDIDRFRSAPGLKPATVTVDKLPHGAEPGDLFVAPQGGPLQDGPEILGPYGGLIWFQPVPKGQTVTDFKVQTYRGKPVLTWWQGTVNGGVGIGTDEIYDSSYRHVATVKAGNGIRADLHEFKLTSQNTALITAYFPVYIDASSVANGSTHQLVLDSIAQEIDVPTGLVLWQWNSLDHVPLSASYQPVPKVNGHPWDYFHINSIQQAPDGTILISSRNTWAVYDVSHTTDATAWTLGGKNSSFKMGPGTQFAFQHDARLYANGLITIFDDGAGPPVVHKQSRGITLKLDTTNMTATLVLADEHQPGLLAAYEGSVEPLANGDDLVGWGEQPNITEYDSHGNVVFDAHFVGANSSYRAFRFGWTGTPATKPSVATSTSSGTTTVYASWNGATELARWRVLGGSSRSKLSSVTVARKSSFETAIKLPQSESYVAVEALDGRGHVLGSSRTVAVR